MRYCGGESDRATGSRSERWNGSSRRASVQPGSRRLRGRGLEASTGNFEPSSSEDVTSN